MKVFVSSTSRDLAEYRTAAIRALRRLGHEVVAMEDFTATRAFPLDRVLRLVRESDAYVVLVAWRYGFRPEQQLAAALPPPPAGRDPKSLSITEWEYLAAQEDRERPVLPFLLAETAPWPPQDMDGFTPDTPGDPGSLDSVRAFRSRLMLDHVVSFFTRPDELEALVGAAVTSARLSRGVRINRIPHGSPVQGNLTTPDSAYAGGLAWVIQEAGDERVVTIDIGTEWWSTRLYLLAFLLRRLTGAQRVLAIDGGSFVGLLPVTAILRRVGPLHEQLARFEAADRARTTSEPDLTRETDALIDLFKTSFDAEQQPAAPGRRRTTATAPAPDPVTAEREAKLTVTRANLARWFEDSIVTNPIRVDSIDRLLPIDLVRIFDYPGDFVPVIVGRDDATTEQDRTHVIDKPALSLQLAQAYVSDLVEEGTG